MVVMAFKKLKASQVLPLRSEVLKNFMPRKLHGLTPTATSGALDQTPLPRPVVPKAHGGLLPERHRSDGSQQHADQADAQPWEALAGSQRFHGMVGPIWFYMVF